MMIDDDELRTMKMLSEVIDMKEKTVEEYKGSLKKKVEAKIIKKPGTITEMGMNHILRWFLSILDEEP